jgi:hypothetical protein
MNEPAQEHYVASSQIRAIVRAEIKQFADKVLAEGIGTALGQLLRENEQRCAALEAQITGLRAAMSERAADHDDAT